jgi:hypothetical protein
MVDEKESYNKVYALASIASIAYCELNTVVKGICRPITKRDLKFCINKLKKKSVLSSALKHTDFSVYQNPSSSFLQECSQYNKDLEDILKKSNVVRYPVSYLRNMLLNSDYKKLTPLFDRYALDLEKAICFLSNLKFTVFSKMLEEA